MDLIERHSAPWLAALLFLVEMSGTDLLDPVCRRIARAVHGLSRVGAATGAP